MKIDHYISELLYEHDCVVVPQFGGFVGNYLPASIVLLQNKLLPPSKTISFNRSLIHNDGLLANYIARCERKKYEEAIALLLNYSELLKQEIKKGRKILLPHIGTLYQDTLQNILFEPDRSTNYLIESFGLPVFYSQPVQPLSVEKSIENTNPPVFFSGEPAEQITVVPLKPANNKRTAPLPSGKVRRSKVLRMTVYSAAATVALLLGWVSLSTNFFRSKTISISDINPFNEQPVPAYNPRSEKAGNENNPALFLTNSVVQTSTVFPDSLNFISYSFFEKGEMGYSENEKIVVKLNENIPQAIGAEKIPDGGELNKRYRFHIIGGCFQYYENAEKFVLALKNKGYNSTIVDRHNGLYRVCYQSYTSRQDAYGLLASVKSSHNNDAWLLVK